MEKNILVVLTGGTICSFATRDGNAPDNVKAGPMLIDNFKKGKSAYKNDVVFNDVAFPINTLSENMTINKWNILLDYLRSVSFENYDGIIIAHGTDTLAYTASMLSLALDKTPVPVVLVSSDYILDDKRANGNDNFKYAVELIAKGARPNVYVTYRNDDGVNYVHYGAHLLQCANYTANFYSKTMVEISKFNDYDKSNKQGEMLLYSLGKLESNVLYIKPYVGLDYDSIDITNAKAVVHGTYHSGTACVDEDNFSVLSLMKRCHDKGIPFFIEPCEKAIYVSANEFLNFGAKAIYGMTGEMVYVKALLGNALNNIESFMATNVNDEFCY